MYKPGTRFEVKIKIVQGSTVVEPGTRGEIVEGIDKAVTRYTKWLYYITSFVIFNINELKLSFRKPKHWRVPIKNYAI